MTYRRSMGAPMHDSTEAFLYGALPEWHRRRIMEENQREVIMKQEKDWLDYMRDIFVFLSVLVVAGVVAAFAVYFVARLDGNGMMQNTYEVAWDWSRAVGTYILCGMWGLYFLLKAASGKK